MVCGVRNTPLLHWAAMRAAPWENSSFSLIIASAVSSSPSRESRVSYSSPHQQNQRWDCRTQAPTALTERHTLVVSRGEELIELALEQLISTGQTKTSCHGEGNVLDATTHRRIMVNAGPRSIHAALSCKTAKIYLCICDSVFPHLRSRNEVVQNLRQHEENATQQKDKNLNNPGYRSSA